MTPEEILQSKYLQFKNTWALPPVDAKYKEMVLEAMKEYAIQCLHDGIVKISEAAKEEAEKFTVSPTLAGIQFGMGLAAGTISKFKDSLKIPQKP